MRDPTSIDLIRITDPKFKDSKQNHKKTTIIVPNMKKITT